MIEHEMSELEMMVEQEQHEDDEQPVLPRALWAL